MRAVLATRTLAGSTNKSFAVSVNGRLAALLYVMNWMKHDELFKSILYGGIFESTFCRYSCFLTQHSIYGLELFPLVYSTLCYIFPCEYIKTTNSDVHATANSRDTLIPLLLLFILLLLLLVVLDAPCSEPLHKRVSVAFLGTISAMYLAFHASSNVACSGSPIVVLVTS